MFDPKTKNDGLTDNEIVNICEAFNEAEEYMKSIDIEDDLNSFDSEN